MESLIRWLEHHGRGGGSFEEQLINAADEIRNGAENFVKFGGHLKNCPAKSGSKICECGFNDAIRPALVVAAAKCSERRIYPGDESPQPHA